MRAGEASDDGTVARRHRPRVPAPTIRALGVLVVLAAALLAITGAWDGSASGRPATRRDARRVEVLGEQVTRVEPSSTTSPSTTTTIPSTTTVPPPAPAAPPAVVPQPAASPGPSMSCAAALAYLAAHQAPGFTDSCADGSAFGHLGVTCVNQPGMCTGQRMIHIACPAPFVYMNEAHNSWTLIGQRTGIDPYGQGDAGERAACAAHR